MRLSARNVLRGTVVEIVTGAVTSHVRIDIGGTIVTTSITNAAVHELALAVGARHSRLDPQELRILVEEEFFGGAAERRPEP